MKPSQIAFIAIALLGLAGCMEVEQTASAPGQGRYQGKPDTAAWENAPLAYGNAKWTKGDRSSWENELKTRNGGQNEYVRIGQ